MTTKDKILDAALELFTENGIDKTSTAKISHAVGLSSGALFVHFPTKMNLIEELYLNRKKCSMQDFSSVIDLDNGAEYNIRAISKKVIGYYASHPKDFIFIRMVQGSPKISERVLRVMKQEYKEHADIMSSWVKKGEVKKMDSELLGNIWWNMMISFIDKMHLEGIQKIKKTWIDFIWESLKK